MAEINENLDWRGAVRKRPAMYIGSTGFIGFSNVIKMIIENVLVQTKSNHFEIAIIDELSGKLFFNNIQSTIKDSINEDLQIGAFEFAVFNALCKNYQFSIYDKNSNLNLNQDYEKGILKNGKTEGKEIFAEKLEILFTLDDSIWDFEKINFYRLNDEIKELAFLFRNKKFEIKYLERGEQSRIFYNFEKGLLDKLELEKYWSNAKITNYSNKVFQDFSIELAFGLSPFYYTEKSIESYVNFSPTKDHGTHFIGLVKGIKKGLKAYIKKYHPEKKVLLKGSAVKKYLFAEIHIQMENPTFWGPTRGKLVTTEIIKPISKYVSQVVLQELEKNPKSAEDIIRHFEYL